MNDEEVERMANYLRMQLPQFKSRHLKQYSKRPGWHMLRSQPGSEKVIPSLVDLHPKVATTMSGSGRVTIGNFNHEQMFLSPYVCVYHPHDLALSE